jgi:hypothetical protein
MSFIIYILYYDEITKLEAEKIYGKYKWARPIFNPTTKYLESGFILDILPTLESEWSDKNYVGTISWKANQKTQIPNFDNLENALKDNIDLIYLLSGEYPSDFESVFRRTDKFHPKFSSIWKKILEKMGYTDIFPKNIVFFYCNYWLSSPTIMKEYIKFGNKVRNIIESQCSDDIEHNSWYGVPPNAYKLLTGKDYYMYHPFIMERIPCYFSYINNIKIRHCKRLNDYPIINTIESNSNVLLIYVYDGKEDNLKKFLKIEHSADCYYVFNSDKPQDIHLKNYIIRKRLGICEGWSDVILNINKDKYDFFIFANDSPIENLTSCKDWIKLLVDLLNYHPHFLQFTETQFIVDKKTLNILLSCIFHSVVNPNIDIKYIIAKARREISLE